jgi:hypothetical protein
VRRDGNMHCDQPLGFLTRCIHCIKTMKERHAGCAFNMHLQHHPCSATAVLGHALTKMSGQAAC